MEDESTCKFCSNSKPQFFVLTAIGKIPMCQTDADKFVAAARTRPTLYPISAINFIESEADMPAYLEKMKVLNRGSEFVEQLVAEEEEKFQGALAKLQGMKEEMAKIDLLITRLKNLHSSLTGKLNNCKHDIYIAKSTKDAQLSTFSQFIVENYEKKTTELYMPLVKDVWRQTHSMLESVVIPSDADQYFTSLFDSQSEPEEVKSLPAITPGVKHSRADSAEPESPPQPNAETPRRRPLRFSARERRPSKPSRDADGNLICQDCEKKIEDTYHQCGEVFYCLDCFERIVADACFRGRAVCPCCNQVPKEIYRYRGMKECGFCCKRLRINEVAHWCSGDNSLSCEKCLARVSRLGKCKKCSVTLNTSY